MTDFCCQLASLRLQYWNVSVFRSRQQWKYPDAFPSLWKSYRHDCIFSPFVATLSNSRSPEKGQIWCEFTGEHGEACERQQNPQACPATTQEGRRANPGVLVTFLFPLLMAAMQDKRETLVHVADVRVNCNGWREGNHRGTKAGQTMGRNDRKTETPGTGTCLMFESQTFWKGNFSHI